MRSRNKEILIVLPNRDEWPAGKTKDEAKLLNLVSAEYGLAADISYFQLHKQKNKFHLKLAFIPSNVGDLHSINAKKFVMFELMRSEINSMLRIDDDLNRRARAILDLVNNDDVNARETIRARLSAILDVSDELENMVDQLLTDDQFNSFKYSVLDGSKTTSLLCVSAGGIFMRSIVAPFEVMDSALWADVKDMSCKSKKLTIHRNVGHVTEVTFLNKKAASACHHHLRQYLAFMGTHVEPTSSSWIGRISQRIRKSLTRRSASRGTASQMHSPSAERPTCAMVTPHKPAAPSTIPESSFISEDVMDNPISLVEPSLKTNSTYDVSLGSDNSYRPTLTSLSNEELSTSTADKLSSFHQKQQGGPYSDDHASMKTTSTYEVSLDSRSMLVARSQPSCSGGDNDSASAQPCYSFGNSGYSNKTSAPIVVPLPSSLPTAVSSSTMPPIAVTPSMQPSTTPNYLSNTHWETPNDRVENGTVISAQIDVELTARCHQISAITCSEIGDLPQVATTASTQPAGHLPTTCGPSPTAITPVTLSKMPPEIPVRTVTQQNSIVMATSPTTYGESNAPADSSPIHSSDITQPTLKAIGAVVHEVAKKMSMTIEPIEEEEIGGQSHEIPDTMEIVVHQQQQHVHVELNVASLQSYMSPLDVDDEPHQIATDAISDDVNDMAHNHHIEAAHDGNDSLQDELPTIPGDSGPQLLSQICVPATSQEASPQEAPPLKQLAYTPTDGRPEILDVSHSRIIDLNSADPIKSESKLPMMSRTRSIPSPKVQRPSRIPAKGISSPKDETNPYTANRTAQSPSDKENYQNDKISDPDEAAEEQICAGDNRPSSNFSRFEGQEYKVDSRTTFTSVSTVGDNIVKKSTQTEISSVKSTGIPTPVTKQYKSTTTITSTIKKPADISKSPINSATKIPTGIPRMSSK